MSVPAAGKSARNSLSAGFLRRHRRALSVVAIKATLAGAVGAALLTGAWKPLELVLAMKHPAFGREKVIQR
jgi:hypothetical protein